MTATNGGPNPATAATLPAIRFDVFDRKCAEKGAVDESARAGLVGVERTTLWRWRTGRQQPSLAVATRVAQQLEVSLDELTGRAA